jgi:Domain of unknown function (DUF3883)
MADWSRLEVEATVASYFEMLVRELRGETVNKRANNRQLVQVLAGRSAGAVEFKHCNISAVLLEAGYPYIEGYKRRDNYQDLLREVVLARLTTDRTLQLLVQRVVGEPVVTYQKRRLLDQVIVPAPTAAPASGLPRETATQPLLLGVNYLEREAQNASLGRAGEEFVLAVEHQRLWQAGQKHLAERVEHVAITQGDGLGYDVRSFEESGQERLIEVKTTRFGPLTPFFATANEVLVSRELPNYQLYRVFRFEQHPKLFILPGALDRSCTLAPTQYRATVR